MFRSYGVYLLVMALLLSLCFCNPLPNLDGRANPAAVVVEGNTRLTVLTPHLLRLERRNAAANDFDDRTSFSVVQRFLRDVPSFKVTPRQAAVNISVLLSGLVVQLPELIVSSSANDFVWTPDTPDTRNLNGTYQALDCYSSPSQCVQDYWKNAVKPGLLSANGWSVLDDSRTSRFVQGKKFNVWFSNEFTDDIDIYLFFYPDLNYKRVLYEYTLIGGQVAMPPRYTLGVWWSMFGRYSQKQFEQQVLQGYLDNRLPLDVAVLDMDWHNEPSDPQCKSWGNYDWNTNLFPDPAAFCQSIHNGSSAYPHPLALSLNLHPDTGVDHCEERYSYIARLLNVSGGATIPCDFSNEAFVWALFRVYLNAAPLNVIDLWWSDWGGCSLEPISNQMFWGNYIFSSNFAGNKRSAVLSRWGGHGSHRMPIGFSGDTFQHELDLDFLIHTTPMAANVLYSWSHDVGGFQNAKWAGSHCDNCCPGDADPGNYTGSVLFLRWVQFAVFSPYFRTHCNHCERRIWMFPSVFPQLKDAFLLRSALVPYLYTAFFDASVTGVVPVRSMYVEDPLAPEAYTHLHQYWFGDSIVVAPVSDATVNVSMKAVWLPPRNNASWFAWNGSVVSPGPFVFPCSLSQIPAFVLGSSVIPLAAPGSAARNSWPDMHWVVFYSLGMQASGRAYFDDGMRIPPVNNLTMTIDCVADTDGSLVCKLNLQNLSSQKHTLQIRGANHFTTATVNGNAASIETCSPSLTCPEGSVFIEAGNTQETTLVVFEIR